MLLWSLLQLYLWCLQQGPRLWLHLLLLGLHLHLHLLRQLLRQLLLCLKLKMKNIVCTQGVSYALYISVDF